MEVRSVEVLGQNVTVEILDLGIDDHGNYDSLRRVIQLNSRDPKPVQAQTLFHEIGHFLFDFTGMGKSEDIEGNEEAIIRMFENGMWSIYGKRLQDVLSE